MLLTHQTCINEILEDNGGNKYDILQMNKDGLTKQNKLPLKIQVCKKDKKFDWSNNNTETTENKSSLTGKAFIHSI